MIWKLRSDEERQERRKQWRKMFLFLPRQVGTDPHGRPIWAWLQVAEKRYPNGRINPIEYRLPGSNMSHVHDSHIGATQGL